MTQHFHFWMYPIEQLLHRAQESNIRMLIEAFFATKEEKKPSTSMNRMKNNGIVTKEHIIQW